MIICANVYIDWNFFSNERCDKHQQTGHKQRNDVLCKTMSFFMPKKEQTSQNQGDIFPVYCIFLTGLI